jgi:hypothetical protein
LDDDTLLTAWPGRGDDDATGPTADEGMVTAELAVALPTVVVTLLAAVTALSAVTTQMRCTDAAATAARLAARGEAVPVAQSAAHEVVGSPAQVQVVTSGGSVTVVVRAVPGMPLLGRLLPLPGVSARYTTPLEPGAQP